MSADRALIHERRLLRLATFYAPLAAGGARPVPRRARSRAGSPPAWLTEGLTGAAAQLSRVALLFYLVFYSAFDSVVGLANGLVAQFGQRLTAAEQVVLPGVSEALSGGGLDQPVPFAISLMPACPGWSR